MGNKLSQETFLCLDCETTGLNPDTDRIIEVAAVQFTLSENVKSFETLIDPECEVPESSIAIHHITQSMLQGKPTVSAILPELLAFIGSHIVIGHGISLDLAFIHKAAKRLGLPSHLDSLVTIDTLRMARLYGKSPTNSLEKLREHFNIPAEGAHRAMSDVIVNIAVFKQLAKDYASSREIIERLKSPIQMKAMPLGKHKGRPFSEIPIEYLRWAAGADFDQDLLYSLRLELNRRKQGAAFSQAANPFSSL